MRKFLFYISIITMIVSLTMILYYVYNSTKNTNIYREIDQIYHKEGKKKDAPENEVVDSANKSNKKDTLDNLRPINKEIVAWIEIPQTKINYPVVQGEDNDYYLNHNIYGDKAKHGSIFMDYRNRASDQNLIIYGHHMKDGSMFKDLIRFKKEDFFKDQKEIYLDMGEGKERYQVFCVSLLSGTTDYLNTSFNDQDDFISYLEKIKKDALYYRDFDLEEDRKILTLSTCSYEFDDARTVVFAYKVE